MGGMHIAGNDFNFPAHYIGIEGLSTAMHWSEWFKPGVIINAFT
jgi:hypothetical protein